MGRGGSLQVDTGGGGGGAGLQVKDSGLQGYLGKSGVSVERE